MDTKWKNRKKIISFTAFFVGASLTLLSVVELLQKWPGGNPVDYLKQAQQDDYQLSRRFRSYIGDRLATFLAMSTNSFADEYYGDYYYDNYYSYGYMDSQEALPPQLWEERLLAVQEEGAVSAVEGWDTGWENYLNRAWEYDMEDWENYSSPDRPLTEEQKEELIQKYEEWKKDVAQKYHESIKADQNLLYAILHDGELLYSNSDLLKTDGSMETPEGYNFFLRYENGQVRISKDGAELDVYGDGFYRADSQWYVPGYRNFQADEEMMKSVVCIAVAEEPILYSEISYGQSGYRQLDNALYWMWNNSRERQMGLRRDLCCLAAGMALLFLSLLNRKSLREAIRSLAGLQGKIWLELRVLFFFALILFLLVSYVRSDYGYGLWQELIWQYECGAEYGYLTEQLLSDLPACLWLTVFWGAWLAVNDFRYNKKPWKNSLARKLYAAFTAKELRLPLARKAAHRSTAAFALAGVYVLLMLSEALLLGHQRGLGARWSFTVLVLLETGGFFLAEYLLCLKNMETARDMEALSRRVEDIRNGNFDTKDCTVPHREDGTPSLAGHDLEQIMAQLEDIRCGMARAVDDQMKSERMKVELIANVSHDIKTPLTSIISYVQFLKEEEGLPEHVRDYVKILDEKSQRLKNMVQDVFAVSKAASGELPMHMEELDFGKLLRQTLADMGEQIEHSPVTFRTEIPDIPVMILADGQRMYRVFQNLFQNALQYSLAGSRVYVTLRRDGNLAVASVKNASQSELAEDMNFAERFTRGDQSRTDGGSGLGLSIAQSFTEACGGKFGLETNADLFVVTISFVTLEI